MAYISVGERIKIRRKELGLSADFLAEKLGVSRSTMFRYESGYIEKFPLDSLEPIASALHTSVEYLMGWEEGSSCSSPTLSSKAIEIGALCEQLNAEGQEKVVEYINLLVNSGIYKKNSSDGMVEKGA